MRRAERALPLRHALALGLLQGPTELLPISSSAHTALLPWLLHWPYAELDGEERKSFELALHAGAGVALMLQMRPQLERLAGELDGERALSLALSAAPAALAGLTLRGPIERHLGGPRTIAGALIAGAGAMAAADARKAGQARTRGQARPADGLALGLAQALALIPGVSRSGATLAAARARGFDRAAASSLSWEAALPVILGATLLELARLARGRGAARGRGPLAVGAIAAFCSTLASARALRRDGYGERALLPYSLYRCLLAALVLGRVRRAQ
jgi:undecaprenyl-diphosphatase